MSVAPFIANSPRVAVIGGGISGLAAALRLAEANQRIDVKLFEAGARCGGVIGTEHVNGFNIEQGPDSVLRALPWGVNLCRRLGISEELIGTNTLQQQTWILRAGRLLPLPDGLAIMAPRRLWPTAVSPILSLSGKLRLAGEWFVPRRQDQADESLARFACRRFGREAFDRLIQPLVSGIYMADPEQLSMRAALPRFVEMEAQHGSLIRAARRAAHEQRPRDAASQSSSSTGSMFVAPREGLGSLVNALVERLPAESIRVRCPVKGLRSTDDGKWQLSLPDGSQERFDGLIVATPSDVAARLLRATDTGLADELGAIAHSGCVIVTLAYERDQISHPLNGHGLVIPQIEKRDIIACSISSVKYARRAPEGQVLLRVFLGGATRPQAMSMNDAELLNVVSRELQPLLGIRGNPTLTRIQRWTDVMPQYHVGHVERIDRIEAQVAGLAGVELAGNSYRGVGIPHCIHSGEQAAERVLKHLTRARRSLSQIESLP